ncbi:hypothetical protein GDO86_008113 [Hymenochirus boettgeri]|uniref:Uncharacterized protein n=1 Tax=Hymenochirus boettgeri TaxID=247094 RepID=A0A8T2IWF2_9PIPI|nr:hypothetical protein GDO86_008113 [Hymenochirus boettgeri]
MALPHDYNGSRSDGRWALPVSGWTRQKLAGVKHTLYHPSQPTLRRMEMDSVGHKLSEEHSRTSTPCTRENFRNATSTLFAAPDLHLPSLAITATGQQISKRYSADTMASLLPGKGKEEWASITNRAVDWSQKVSSCGEYQLRDVCVLAICYSVYTVRLLSPDVTHSWRVRKKQTILCFSFAR